MRDGNIKSVLNGFNSKQYKKIGSNVSNDDEFVKEHTSLAQNLYDAMKKADGDN